MNLKLTDLTTKIAQYSSTILIGKAKSWMTKFAIGAGTEAMLGKVESFVRATGTVSEDGCVDLDALHRIVTAGFKSAGHIDLFGGLVGFDPQDAEDLFAFIERGV